jgi:hypothetical protein
MILAKLIVKSKVKMLGLNGIMEKFNEAYYDHKNRENVSGSHR